MKNNWIAPVSKRHLSIFAISSVILLFGSIVIIALWRIDDLERMSRPLLIYQAATVAEVCHALRIAPSDPFCEDLEVQTASMLIDMLNRNFPPGSTSYPQIISVMRNLPMFSPIWSDRHHDLLDGECRPPNASAVDRDNCIVLFPGEVGFVEIFFEANGAVKNYHPWRTLGENTE